MRGITVVCHPKILFRYQFRCRHEHENVSIACMNPVLMKLSTRVVNWHSNIIYLATRQPTVAATISFHTIYCEKTYGSYWNVLNEFCNIMFTVDKFCTTSLFKFYCNLLKILDSATISW